VNLLRLPYNGVHAFAGKYYSLSKLCDLLWMLFLTHRYCATSCCRGLRNKFYQRIQKLIPAYLASGVLVETCIAIFYSYEHADETVVMLLETDYLSYWQLAHTIIFVLDYKKSCVCTFVPKAPVPTSRGCNVPLLPLSHISCTPLP